MRSDPLWLRILYLTGSKPELTSIPLGPLSFYDDIRVPSRTFPHSATRILPSPNSFTAFAPYKARSTTVLSECLRQPVAILDSYLSPLVSRTLFSPSFR